MPVSIQQPSNTEKNKKETFLMKSREQITSFIIVCNVGGKVNVDEL